MSNCKPTLDYGRHSLGFDVTPLRLRVIAVVATATSLLCVTAPFWLHDWMPPDPVEPHKISFGVALLLALVMLWGFAVNAVCVLTGILAAVRRDWAALAISLPAPAVTLGFAFYFWMVEGM